MIVIKNLSKRYKDSKTEALKDISFTFPSTGLYYLVGESGSGKSSLIKILGSIDLDYLGSVKFNNRELRSFSDKERQDYLLSKVSLALQEDELDYNFSVRDNLMLALEVVDIKEPRKNERIKEALLEVGLSKNIDTKLSLLSGGEVKRVNLARALIKDYEVLLLDEPLGPLDEHLRKRLIELFKKIAKHKLVIVISHNEDDLDFEHDNILRMKDGRILVESKNYYERYELIKSEVKRKKFTFLKRLANIFKMFRRRLKHTLLSIFATSLALTSLGITSILTDGVNLSLKSFLTDEIDDRSLVMKRKTTEIYDDYFRGCSYYLADEIKNNYDSYVYDVGSYYEGNYEDLFEISNKTYIRKNDRSLYFNNLSLRDFIEFTYIKEIDDCNFKDLKNDEIILGVNESSFKTICEFLNIFYPTEIETLNNYLINNPLSIYLELQNNEFNYRLVVAFNIVSVYESKENKIIHSNPRFNEWLVEDEMEFLTKDKYEDSSVPWTFFKSYFLYTYPSKRRNFINEIRKDPNYKEVSFSNLESETNEDINFKNGRVLLLLNYKEETYISDVEEIVDNYRAEIDNYYLFNSYYSYFEEGLTRSFLKPTYISSKKELINELIDVNYEANLDLEGFQGASIVSNEEVVRGDIISSSNKTGLEFDSNLDKELLKGYRPTKLSEIVISKGLADIIFKDKRFFLDSYVYLTCLKSTSYENGTYKNNFGEAKLKVTGVVDEERLVIYQKPEFIFALSEDQFKFKLDEVRVDKALINFKDEESAKRIIEELKTNYNFYDFSLPSLEISEGIDEILNYVKIGLFSFSLLTGSIALFLLVFVMFLFIKDDENKIRLMLLEGYLKRDVISYYSSLSLTISTLSFLESFLTVLVIDFLFKINIENMLGVSLNIFNLKVFLLIFVATLAFSTISLLLVYFKLKKVKLSSQFVE